jgi:glycosyltransferase involved in cell wall biosynthesis
MRAGLPAVASDIPGSGVGFVVRNNETGLLVPPGDVPALAAALQRMANDAALRNRLGIDGQKRWRDEFTLCRSADQTLALYHQLLSTGAPV